MRLKHVSDTTTPRLPTQRSAYRTPTHCTIHKPWLGCPHPEVTTTLEPAADTPTR
jgi:hypothetical protein